MKIEENNAKPTGNIEQWRTCSPNQKYIYIYLGHLQTWVPPPTPKGLENRYFTGNVAE